MASGKDFRELSKARIKVAQLLMKKADYNGVVDNVGYALELALKSVICKKLNLTEYPDAVTVSPSNRQQYKTEEKIVNFFKTHDLVILLILSGLSNYFDVATSNVPNLSQNWGYVATTWSTEVRYERVGTYLEPTAQRMINALISTPDGIITFIKDHKKW